MNPGRGTGLGRGPAGAEDGIAMVIAVIITGIVFLLGAVWVNVAQHATNASRYARHREQAIDAAQAGLVVAVAALSRNAAYAGTTALTDFPGGSAMYEVAVTNDSAAPVSFRRVVTATGYAPSPSAPGRARRTLRQVVDLAPVGFQYGLMSEGPVVTGSSSSVVGDIYANGSITLGNSQSYAGNIHVRGNLTTGSNQSITGEIRADGDVYIDSSSTRVKGSVYAGGAIRTGGTIDDDAMAGGTISPAGTGSWCPNVGRTCSPRTSPPLVPPQHLPTFTWNPDNYPAGTVQTLTGTQTVAALKKTNAKGVYYVNGDVSFSGNDTLYLTGDLTIVATGSISVPQSVENHTSGAAPVQLSIISTGGGAIKPANNFTIPSTVRTLIYTTGQFVSSNSSTFSGALYVGSLSNGAGVNITSATHDDVGFNWTSANPQSFRILHVSTREVAA